ncbi:hypothetical protein J2848_005230 [Azospirillum lipoferum]|uniref:Uncharacterized protein n=1 Tax=Azospirillum lipoferum TaxID=193 RepID=A0A5A9GHC3_AZOLI|nr:MULTISPECIES: hypothetical protein [Azospirillum]KAA0593132.1 hypothetical protein FZ942_24645 [Azospirillum lipoferum]MCP1613534.1 hypothetical protein [Azospirillum lipoferum]MDW5532303.1 hypothetical protein [Azospirillum sp. NL1]
MTTPEFGGYLKTQKLPDARGVERVAVGIGEDITLGEILVLRTLGNDMPRVIAVTVPGIPGEEVVATIYRLRSRGLVAIKKQCGSAFQYQGLLEDDPDNFVTITQPGRNLLAELDTSGK